MRFHQSRLSSVHVEEVLSSQMPQSKHDEPAREGVPGAIILGNEYQALGLLRRLSAVGVKCVLIDQDAYGPALFSRFRTQFYRSPSYQSIQFWPWLSSLARAKGYVGWIIIPTDDEQVRQLAENFDEAQSLFRYVGLPWKSYQHIYNKRQAQVLATGLGVSVPKAFIPNRRSDFPKPDEMEYPLIIKPAFKREFSKVSKKKAIVAKSPEHLQRILNGPLRTVPIEQLLYQELIPGDGSNQWSYCGFFVDGEPIAAFTACRRRQKPPDFGRASTYVQAAYDEEVERQSRKVLAAIKYTGLAEVEWKRDARDHKLKFLEVNARCWGWHMLASRVVGNLPLMLYDYLVEGTVRRVEPHYGPKWVKWITDIPVSVHVLARRKLSILEYVNDLKGDVVSCEWDRSDPLPFFLQIVLLPYLILRRGY